MMTCRFEYLDWLDIKGFFGFNEIINNFAINGYYNVSR